MKRVSGDDRKELDAITNRLRSAESDLESAIERFNEQMREEFALVSAAVTEYNEAVEMAKDLRDRISEAITDYMADRSDRWHESERGSAYETWRDALDGIALDPIEIPQPDEIEAPDDKASESLESDWQDEPEI